VHRRFLLTFPVLLLPVSLVAEPAGDAAVVELREAVRGWIEVEDRISAEAADWQVEKDRTGRLLALYREELKLLDEELAKAGTSAGGHEERMAAAGKKLKRLRAVQDQAKGTVAASVPRLLKLADQFPGPLRAEAADDLATLEAWKPGDAPRDGLRALLGVLSRADTFHRRLTRTSEVRGGREVEVLYLGLARAFYVGNGTAGIGVPGVAGWSWSERAELSGQLERALEMLDQKRQPGVVKLPMQVGHPAKLAPGAGAGAKGGAE
jgi:hypothetical protein